MRTVTAVLFTLALSCLGGSAMAKCELEKIADLPVTMVGTKAMVAAKINGADVRFIADSGAFYSTLSLSTAKENKLNLGHAPDWFRLRGVGGDAEAWLTTVRTFTLANTPIHNVEFIVHGAGFNDAAGLLGQNVLGLADVEYDLGHGMIRLWRPKGCGRGVSLAYWANEKPISIMNIQGQDLRNPHTIGDAYLNGVKISVTFDTGAGQSVLTLDAAKRAGIRVTDPGVKPGGFSYGLGDKMLRGWIIPVKSFKLGDNEEMINTQLRMTEGDLTGADMLLGADFFLSHRVYVSNRQDKVYFSYNGGPVFDLTAKTFTATAAGATPQLTTVGDDLGPEPTDAEDYSRRGNALASRRDFEHALADLTRACDLAPTESRYPYERAMIRLALKQPVLAMADLDQALKLKPDDVRALVTRAELKLSQNDNAGALTDVDAAAKAAPKEADIRLQLGNLYERGHRLDDSIAQYGLWIDAHPDDALVTQALNGRCWSRALSGRDLELALKDCNRALGHMRDTPMILDSRGLVYLRMGRFDKALTDYDAALAQQPNLAWSLYGRGLAKINLGRKAEGLADLAAASKLRPKLADLAKGYGIAPPAGS